MEQPCIMCMHDRMIISSLSVLDRTIQCSMKQAWIYSFLRYLTFQKNITNLYTLWTFGISILISRPSDFGPPSSYNRRLLKGHYCSTPLVPFFFFFNHQNQDLIYLSNHDSFTTKSYQSDISSTNWHFITFFLKFFH